MTAKPSLTILFDNRPSPVGLTKLWGFSALIETGERTLLFDTGSNGRVLLKNMATLGLSMDAVDQLFLSHAHWDHIGGLDSVLEANPALSVVLHEGFSKHLIRDLRGLCREVIVIGAEPQTFAPGLISTGLLESQPPEQGLILKHAEVTAAISGCAHPGMDQIIERGLALLGEPIRWAIGGFHLMYADGSEITRSVHTFQTLGVTDVLPTHCTGDAAIAAFEATYRDRCVAGGAGRRLVL